MKKLSRVLLLATFVAVLAAGASVLLAASGEKASPIGSIRPAGKVEPADLPALAKIPFQRALDAALARVPGSVIKAELEVEDGNLMYSFEIVGPGRKITEVEVDAGNGTILDTDEEAGENQAAGAGQQGKD